MDAPAHGHDGDGYGFNNPEAVLAMFVAFCYTPSLMGPASVVAIEVPRSAMNDSGMIGHVLDGFVENVLPRLPGPRPPIVRTSLISYDMFLYHKRKSQEGYPPDRYT